MEDKASGFAKPEALTKQCRNHVFNQKQDNNILPEVRTELGTKRNSYAQRIDFALWQFSECNAGPKCIALYQTA